MKNTLKKGSNFNCLSIYCSSRYQTVRG